jgi:hypothetical protein
VGREETAALHVINIEVFPGDEIAQFLRRRPGIGFHECGAFSSDAAVEVGRQLAGASDMAVIARACSRTRLARLEHHGHGAALCQNASGRKPAIAASDDGHVTAGGNIGRCRN